MKITQEQARAILPMLKRAVKAQEKRWDAEHEIESYLDTNFDNMGEMIETLAVDGRVTLSDVKHYIANLEVSK